MKPNPYYRLVLLLLSTMLWSQPWIANDELFNPSGVPSVTFSAPHFADLDNDSDLDLILGGSNVGILFLENIGSVTDPQFSLTEFVTHDINSLEGEIAAAGDLDSDGDLDLVTGGYIGLTCFWNTGTPEIPVLQRDTLLLSGLSCGANPAPTLADVNGDSLLDLMIGRSENGSLKYYLNSGVRTVPAFNEDNAVEPGIDVGLYAYPNLSDPDEDDDYDILVGRDDIGLRYYRNEGTAQSPAWNDHSEYVNGLASNEYFTVPCLVDLNGNGKVDLVYGHYGGPLVYYTNSGTGITPNWTINTSTFGGVLDAGGASNPCLFDFDADGDLDMLSGYNMGGLKYYRNIGTPASSAWEEDNSAFGSIDLSIYSSVAVGDINGDQLPDLLMGDVGSGLYLYENTGSGFVHNTAHFSGISIGWWLIPQLVDIDFDSDLDIVVANDGGNIYLYVNQGSILSPAYVMDGDYFSAIAGPSNSAPAVVDLDRDGDYDLLVGGISGTVQYFQNTGNALNPVWVDASALFTGVETDQNATPAFGDLDNDGDADLVLGDYDGTFRYFENQNTTTGLSDGDQPGPVEFSVAAVYPNPFNNQITFSMIIPAAGLITIDFFNLLGQRVYTTASDYQVAGTVLLTVPFPESMASGIYLHNIRYQSVNRINSHTGRVIYLK